MEVVMNIQKMNELMEKNESRRDATPSNDPLYDYLRGKCDGILAAMNQLGYVWMGQIGGFRRNRKA